jgi:hypothetical protein
MPEMPSGDPYIEGILHKVPEKVARELTPEQWEGFREALRRTRDNPRHVLDVRFVLPLYFTRLYCIFIFGKDVRERVQHVLIERRKRVFSALGALVLASCFVGLVALVLAILYVLKTVAGIDLIPDWHLRDWLF